MHILILNGPNINLLGLREPEIYGSTTYEDLVHQLREYAESLGISVSLYQSNHEGSLVDRIQAARFDVDAIIINPAAYSHTSIAILDALKAVHLPTVEVHISNPKERETFRHHSYVSEYAEKIIMGQGVAGYNQAIDYLVNTYKRA
ncbi:type II 3-dehydroquinate dehydratase [Veillonella intestinalis]|uniref:type II 3-dehydroquinate dehydratase n=1 Tax=Veillonella intestinalis TaxID=2941341 RepID=UPI00203C22A9|nr:type II 3-dehydroquinate dehydratase [Veillonella intestinalis]